MLICKEIACPNYAAKIMFCRGTIGNGLFLKCIKMPSSNFRCKNICCYQCSKGCMFAVEHSGIVKTMKRLKIEKRIR